MITKAYEKRMKSVAKFHRTSNPRKYAKVARVTVDGLEVTDGFIWAEVGTIGLKTGFYSVESFKKEPLQIIFDAEKYPKTDHLKQYFCKAEKWETLDLKRYKWIHDVKDHSCVVAIDAGALVLQPVGVAAPHLSTIVSVLGSDKVEYAVVDSDVYLFKTEIGRAIICDVKE